MDWHKQTNLENGDNGNVIGITNYKDSTRSQSFTVACPRGELASRRNALNRLASAQNAGTNCNATTATGASEYWGNSYGYDPWGNLLQKRVTKCGGENLSVTALANNQLSGYGYDAAGNMTQDATTGNNYVYDAENRITGAAGYTYMYDADGNRVEKSNGSTGTIYWSMSPGIVAASDLSGNLQSEYVFFKRERVARKDFSTGAVSYYFSDDLQTASVITNSSGTVTEDEDFYPWGGEVQFVNGDSNHYKFTAKERDTETGLDYFGARYYGNWLGRWMSPDWAAKPEAVPYSDLHDPQSLNLYSYVRNVPTSKTDVDGHQAAEVAPAVIVTTVVVAVATAIILTNPSVQQAIKSFINKLTNGSEGKSLVGINPYSGNNKTPPPPPGTGTGSASQPKDVYIDPNKYPESAGHATDAQEAGQPDVLTVDRGGADARRAAATSGTGTQAGKDRDEYPPAVTAEGGQGASVKSIPSSDNRGAGASLGQQIRDVPDGGQIKVNVGPKAKPQKN